jgi:acetyltransferase-like isoleucine patch superfamily enzyme
MMIEQMLNLVREAINGLPLVRSARNEALRPEIAARLASQLLTDDERAKYFSLPAGCRIREGAKILSPEKLRIGQRCWIGENAILDASGGLEIGDDCSIGLSVFVWTHSSHLTNLARDNISNSDLIQRNATSIGNGVFIAGPSVVLPGSIIGDNVVIRPFSTVSGNVPSGALVDGKEIIEGVFNTARIERMIERQKGES